MRPTADANEARLSFSWKQDATPYFRPVIFFSPSVEGPIISFSPWWTKYIKMLRIKAKNFLGQCAYLIKECPEGVSWWFIAAWSAGGRGFQDKTYSYESLCPEEPKITLFLKKRAHLLHNDGRGKSRKLRDGVVTREAYGYMTNALLRGEHHASSLP